MEIIDVSTTGTLSAELLARPVIDTRSLEHRVAAILSTVREEGDRAVREFSLKFDQIAPETFELRAEEINAGASEVGEELKIAIRAAYTNILNFHNQQRHTEAVVVVMPGGEGGGQAVGIGKVGFYFPGGSGPL